MPPYGDILPAEGHLLDLLEPEDVVPAWKRWSPILLRPDGLYGRGAAQYVLCWVNTHQTSFDGIYPLGNWSDSGDAIVYTGCDASSPGHAQMTPEALAA